MDEPADVLRLDAKRRPFGTLVFLSSGAVYDISRALDRVSEDDLGEVAAFG